MTVKVDLMIIDPQNDFCLKPEEGAALSVAGAKEDMQRVAEFIRKFGSRLNDIHVTLDCHHLFDIAHPIFWVDSKGNNPTPFTVISYADVKSGKWMTSIPSLQQLGVDYTKSLEDGKRYPLVIWPPHCLIGTPGNNVVAELSRALFEWETEMKANVDFITKGSNPFTEHYSAVAAEVLDPRNPDPSIAPNPRFFDILEKSDVVIITGEASDYCVANTVLDMIHKFPNALQYTKKLVFFKDASSAVDPTSGRTQEFLDEMIKHGMTISTTVDYFK